MRKKKIGLILLAMVAAMMVTAVVVAQTTHGWLMQAGDDAYVLCSGEGGSWGAFAITPLSPDALYLECNVMDETPANEEIYFPAVFAESESGQEANPPVVLGPGATMVVCYDGSKPQILERWLPLMLQCPEKRAGE